MADQDFNINIRTTANTAGVEQIKAALSGLGAQVNSFNAVSGGGGGGGESGGSLLDKAAAKIEHGIFRTAVHAIGIGVVYELVGALREQAKEIEKVSDELDKQGEKLVKNAQQYAQATRFATTEADVIKIGSAAMKDVEEAHKKVIELQKEELSLWAQFSDIVNSIVHDTEASDETYAAAKKANEATAQLLETTAKQSQYDEIRAAKIQELRRSTQSYEETVAELTARMKEQQDLANTNWANKDVASYLSAASAAENYRKELEALKEAHGKLTSKTEKYVEGADPQVKAILANEKAMFEARAAGRGIDADRFERSAQALRRGARPDQLAEVDKIYGSPVVVDALKQIEANTRTLIDLWK